MKNVYSTADFDPHTLAATIYLSRKAERLAAMAVIRPPPFVSRRLAALVAFLVGTSAVRSELTTMTYQSDHRIDKQDDKFCISWIICGGIVLAIVIATLAFTNTGNYPDLGVPQITTTVPGPAS